MPSAQYPRPVRVITREMLPDFIDPVTGHQDINALVAASQGGPYDAQARRDAIAAALAQQIATMGRPSSTPTFNPFSPSSPVAYGGGASSGDARGVGPGSGADGVTGLGGIGDLGGNTAGPFPGWGGNDRNDFTGGAPAPDPGAPPSGSTWGGRTSDVVDPGALTTANASLVVGNTQSFNEGYDAGFATGFNSMGGLMDTNDPGSTGPGEAQGASEMGGMAGGSVGGVDTSGDTGTAGGPGETGGIGGEGGGSGVDMGGAGGEGGW